MEESTHFEMDFLVKLSLKTPSAIKNYVIFKKEGLKLIEKKNLLMQPMIRGRRKLKHMRQIWIANTMFFIPVTDIKIHFH